MAVLEFAVIVVQVRVAFGSQPELDIKMSYQRDYKKWASDRIQCDVHRSFALAIIPRPLNKARARVQ
jgi:hypothetical protein